MPDPRGGSLDARLTQALRRVVDVRHAELRPLLLSGAYFFFILASYYILRPLREEMGVAGGVDNLAWLFTGTLAGFTLLGLAPILGAFAVFQVLRRAGEFAVAKPTRELLYTVVEREDKYKAKNLIDTFVYRAGDQIAAWSYTGFLAAGLSMSAISFVLAPLAAVWLVLALWLGRRQSAFAALRPRPPGGTLEPSAA